MTDTTRTSQPSNRPRRSSEVSARIPEVCAVIAASIALLALAGWISGARFLAGEWGTYIPMAPSTALVFLLLSSALFCVVRWPEFRLTRLLAWITAAIAILIALLVLGQFLTGVDLGIEQALSRTNELLGSTPVGRMSPVSAVAFLFESTVLLLLAERWRHMLMVAALAALAATITNVVVLIGYAYGTPFLYGGSGIPVALPTAFAFVLLGVSEFHLAAPGVPALRVWSSTSLRGILLRAFLPAVLIVILLDGWLDVRLEASATLNAALWHSLESLAAAALILIVTGWIARRTGGELERTQKTLADSEAKFRSVFENSPLGISLTGLDRSMNINRAFCDIVGYSEEELTTKDWKDISHPDDVQESMDVTQAMLEGRISHARFEKRYIHKNGSIVWTDLTTAAQRDSSGKPLYFITTVSDITERKRAEQTLREKDDRFRALIENSADAITLLDSTGTVLYDSPSAPGLLGYGPHDWIGQNVFALIHPDDLPEMRRLLERLTQTPGARISTTFRIHHQSGTWLEMEAVATNLLEEPAVQAIVVNYRDVSERRRAEQALRTISSYNRRLIEASLDPLVTIGPDGKITDVNQASEAITGVARQQLIGDDFANYFTEPEQARASYEKVLAEGSVRNYPLTIRHVSGKTTEVLYNATVYRNENGAIEGVFAAARDITETRRAEQAVQTAKQELEQFFDLVPDLVAIASTDGFFQKLNLAWEATLGFTRQELQSQPYESFVHPDDIEPTRQQVARQLAGYQTVHFTNRYRTRDGSYRWLEWQAAPSPDGRTLNAAARDITERKKTEEALQAGELRFRTLIEQAPIAISVSRDGIGLYANQQFARLAGLQNAEQAVGRPIAEYFAPEFREESRERSRRRSLGLPVPPEFESVFLPAGGAPIPIHAAVADVQLADGPANIAFVTDITDRKRAEAERQALLEIMQASLTDSLQEFLELVRQSLGRVLDAENLFVVFQNSRTGMFEEVFAVDKYDAPMPPSRLEKSITSYVFRTGEPLLLTAAKFEQLKASGEVELVGTPQASWLGAPLKTPTSTIGVIAVQNYEDTACYTERDKTFLASVGAQVGLMIQRKQAEAQLHESEERFSRAFHSSPAAAAITAYEDGKFEDVNEDFLELVGYTRQEVIGRSPKELRLFPDLLEFANITKHLQETGALRNMEVTVRSKSGVISYVLMSADVIELNGQRSSLSTLVDITARKQAEENTQTQLRRLSALRTVDTAISSSFDLRVTLNILLEHVINELHVDAADVLLLNHNSNELEYAAGRGFRGTGITRARIKLGAPYSGQAVLERRTINVPDLAEAERPLARANLISDENFVAFYSVPFVAKGQVKGVLELFHRSRLTLDPESLDFLETLAGQAGIAIDSAQLFGELQRSNTELSLAYDATIEGWSQAMDLRDKETEGHTLRVTETAVKLGRAMGLSEEDLMHIRRGALLHDIGKMGVPDSILLKPGPLTDEEWVIMKRHPALAYEMLSQVRYLRPAIDIPYCHHEKWDGSGYPRGLKHDEIPLAARMFAIIDVYDALTSDRPYRAAWPTEKVLEHIRSESGKHFDPQVVDAFLGMLASK